MSELKRPIHIEEFTLALRELSDAELGSIRKQINNSISKLNTSNELMTNLLEELNLKQKRHSDEDVYQESQNEIQKDIDLYKESIHENGIVLRNQLQRVDALETELENRGLSLADDGNAEVKKAAEALENKKLSSQDNDDLKEGIYL